jgi:hypothetical protein
LACARHRVSAPAALSPIASAKSLILKYAIASDGLHPNLLAFNVGVEIGQILALA